MLPLTVSPQQLVSRVPHEARGLPIGIDELRLDPVLLDLAGGEPHLIVLGDGESGKTNMLRWIARSVIDRYGPHEAQIAVVDYRRNLLDLANSPHVGGYAASARMASDLTAQLQSELGARLPGPEASREELLRGPEWSGPHWYLLVDDYDLVPSQMENPLGGLVDLLAHGRDVGLHVVLARRVGGSARGAYEPFFQRLTELRPPGLILSGDPDEGPLMAGRRAEPQPPGRGLLVQRGLRPGLIQTPLAEPDARPGGPDSPDPATHSTQGVSA